MCPSIAAVTTWQSSLRALVDGVEQRGGVLGARRGLQNRCSTPQPVLGLKASLLGHEPVRAVMARQSTDGAGEPMRRAPHERLSRRDRSPGAHLERVRPRPDAPPGALSAPPVLKSWPSTPILAA